MAEAYEGLIADSRIALNVKSAAAEGDVPFGYGCVAGTDDEKQVKVPAADTDVFRGIAVHTHKQSPNIGTPATEYADEEAVGYMTQGGIWVPTTVAVSNDEDAYVNVAIGGSEGKFTNVSTGNIATGGKFKKTIGAAGLSIVELPPVA
jgi:hypothetical protein